MNSIAAEVRLSLIVRNVSGPQCVYGTQQSDEHKGRVLVKYINQAPLTNAFNVVSKNLPISSTGIVVSQNPLARNVSAQQTGCVMLLILKRNWQQS